MLRAFSFVWHVEAVAGALQWRSVVGLARANLARSDRCGLSIEAALPVAFLLSLIGVLNGQYRTVAIGGRVISGLSKRCVFGLPLLKLLHK